MTIIGLDIWAVALPCVPKLEKYLLAPRAELDVLALCDVDWCCLVKCVSFVFAVGLRVSATGRAIKEAEKYFFDAIDLQADQPDSKALSHREMRNKAGTQT